jgi:hypothetical protein
LANILLQRAAQLSDALNIVGRQEQVYMRQHCSDAHRFGLELGIPQHRIHPDQLATGSMQPLHLKVEI